MQRGVRQGQLLVCLTLQLSRAFGEVLLDEVLLALLGQVLEGESLSLREKKGGEDTGKPDVSLGSPTNGRETHMKKAKSSMMCGRNAPLPPMSMRRAKPTWATMAAHEYSRREGSMSDSPPSLPEAAQIPCAVDLYRVGKTSPGMTEIRQGRTRV